MAIFRSFVEFKRQFHDTFCRFSWLELNTNHFWQFQLILQEVLCILNSLHTAFFLMVKSRSDALVWSIFHSTL